MRANIITRRIRAYERRIRDLKRDLDRLERPIEVPSTGKRKPSVLAELAVLENRRQQAALVRNEIARYEDLLKPVREIVRQYEDLQRRKHTQ